MQYKFDTNSVHAGFTPDRETGCVSASIHPATAYVFESAQAARDIFALQKPGNIYSRITNPTNEILEKRMAALDGGAGALALASGHAAISLTVFCLAGVGDEIISSSRIYGGAVNMLGISLGKLGIKTHFVDLNDLELLESRINDKTKAIFFETIGNPNATLCDIEALSKIAKKHGIPLIADSTFTTPALLRPVEYGADIIIHSGTKYLAGHGNAMCGIVVDSGKFNFKDNPRFPDFNEPDESYHGIVYARDCGQTAFITKLRVQMLRDYGPCLSPFNAYMTLIGIETLSLRMKKHSENGLAAAEFLEGQREVKAVNYPGLKSNPQYALCQKYLPLGASSVFTIELKGGRAAGEKFIESLKLISHVANVGDTRSLVVHPASTTHSQLTAKQLLETGITEGTVRLSIGIEDIEDIIGDLKQALDVL